MKLLFDQNLSHTLVARLRDVFPGSQHVRGVGLSRGEDREIWQFAIEDNLAIVTKDADFRALSTLHGHPPKVNLVDAGELLDRSDRAPSP